MKPETRKFERSYIRKRNEIEKKGIRMATAAIVAQYKSFLEQAKKLAPEQWLQIQVSEAPVKQFFNKFYPMSGELGLMTRNHMIKAKSDDDAYLSVFETRMQHLVSTKVYSERIKTITNTTNSRIDAVLQDVFLDAEMNGYGIDKIKTNLISAIGKSIKGNVLARAKGIAQTEMISASNQASMYAADSTGLEYRKFWSTSHLQNIRPSHMIAEQDSIQRGGLNPEQPFANGLMYPGDPNGSAEETVNCRCTVLHEII